MTKTYLVADLFCGAGGSSTGARKAIEQMGGRMELVAVNHWPLAVETHQLNHPEARHYVQDVEKADPEQIVPGGRLDLLMASPECKFYSRARGGKPVHDQGRMTPWAIMNWITKLDIERVLIENVVEFLDWGPVRNGRPIKAQKGMVFQAWFRTFQDLGYRVEWRKLNAADYGDATTRTRLFIMARKDGSPVRWPEPSHARGDTGMFPGRKPWRGAREIINWNNLGRSLLDDPKYVKKPLSIKTMMRIARGLARHGGKLAPLYVRLLDLEGMPEAARERMEREMEAQGAFALDPRGQNGSGRGQGCLQQQDAGPFHSSNRQNTLPRDMDQPMLTATGATGGGNYLVVPGTEPLDGAPDGAFVGANRNQNVPRDVGQPVPPATTSGGLFVVQPEAGPFLIGQHGGSSPRPAGEPAPTVTAQSKIRLISPTAGEFLLGQQSGATPRDLEEPAPTIAAAGAIALVRANGEPFVLSHQRNTTPRGMGEPVPSNTGRGPGYLVKSTIIQYYGQSSFREVDQPLSTIATFNKHGLASPTLIEYYGNGGDHSSAEDPLHTVTTRARHALARPVLTEVNHGDKEEKQGGGRRTPEVDRPLGSLTSRRGLGLASPILVQTGQTGGNGGYARPVEDPAPVLTTRNDTHVVTPGADPFMVPNFGERDGQEPRVHPIDQPAPAVTGKGAGRLISPTIAEAGDGWEEEEARGVSEQTAREVLEQALRENIDPRRIVFLDGRPYLLDIRFRMLENQELARAMGFDDQESKYEFVGNTSQITKQIGNAVPVNLAAALVGAALE